MGNRALVADERHKMSKPCIRAPNYNEVSKGGSKEGQNASMARREEVVATLLKEALWSKLNEAAKGTTEVGRGRAARLRGVRGFDAAMACDKA